MDKDLLSIIDKIELIHSGYSLKSSKDTLNDLLAVYEELNPNWKEEYNRREKEKLNIRTTKSKTIDTLICSPLPENFSLANLRSTRKIGKESDILDPIELGRILHLSNKTAHAIEQQINKIITEYVTKESSKGREFIGYDVATNNGMIINRKFLLDLKDIFKIPNEVYKEYRIPIDAYERAEEEYNKANKEYEKIRKKVNSDTKKYKDCGVTSNDFADLFKLNAKLRKMRKENRQKTPEYEDLKNEQEKKMAEITSKVPENDVKALEKNVREQKRLAKRVKELEEEKEKRNEERKKASRENIVCKKIRKLENRFGFESKDIKYLESQNLQQLWRAYTLCMNMKDMAIEDIHRIIQERNIKDISYGVSDESENGDKTKKLFYMDVPEYGQFSVHYIPAVINITDFPEYRMSFGRNGRREQIMLTKYYSKEFKAFADEECFDSPEFDEDIGLGEEQEDGTIKPKYGIEVPEERKVNYRKIRDILDLELGDTKKDLEVIKSIRHQLAIGMKLPKEFLEILYDCKTLEDLPKKVHETEFEPILAQKENNDER